MKIGEQVGYRKQMSRRRVPLVVLMHLLLGCTDEPAPAAPATIQDACANWCACQVFDDDADRVLCPIECDEGHPMQTFPLSDECLRCVSESACGELNAGACRDACADAW